jgi:hypothetical protein
VEHRKPGRPPLKDGEASTTVTVTLTVSDYDRAYARASRHGVSVPEVLRAALRRLWREPEK